MWVALFAIFSESAWVVARSRDREQHSRVIFAICFGARTHEVD